MAKTNKKIEKKEVKKEVKKVEAKEPKEKKATKKEFNFIEILSNEKNRKLIRAIAIGLLVIIVLIVIAVALSGEEEKTEKPKKEDNAEVIVSDENTIKEEYGFSKEDAIAVVKKSYNSDNYEFSAKAREDNKYIVTVKNTETGSTYKYVVDPNDGSYSTLEN